MINDQTAGGAVRELRIALKRAADFIKNGMVQYPDGYEMERNNVLNCTITALATPPGLDPATVEACRLEADNLIGKHGSLDPWAKGFNAGCADSGNAIHALLEKKTP